MTKDFAKDLIRYLPSKMLPGLFGFLTIPIFTRVFDPTEYGHYVLVMSTVSVLSILATDWISTAIIRFYPEYQSNSENDIFSGTIIRITLWSIFATTFTTFTVLFFFRSFFKDGLYLYFNIGLLILASGIAFNIMMHMLVAKRMATQYSIFSIWRQIICILIGLFIVVIFKMGVKGMLLGVAFGIFFILPITFKLSFGDNGKNKYSNKLSKNLIRYGIPLAATNLSAWILALSDRYIIEYFRGSEEVGLYSISYSLADSSIMLIVSLIMVASQPIVMNKWENEGAEETRLFIRGLTKLYLLITLPATVGLSILSEPIIIILTSEKYYAGYKIIPLVAASIFIFGLQRNFQLGLLFFKKTKLIMYLVLIAGLTNITANIIFVPRYGLIAAAYSTLFSYIIFAILSIMLSRRYFQWQFPFETFAKVLIATVVMGGVVLSILRLQGTPSPFMLILPVISGVLVYVSLLILMKEFDKNMLNKIINFR